MIRKAGRIATYLLVACMTAMTAMSAAQLTKGSPQTRPVCVQCGTCTVQCPMCVRSGGQNYCAFN